MASRRKPSRGDAASLHISDQFLQIVSPPFDTRRRTPVRPRLGAQAKVLRGAYPDKPLWLGHKLGELTHSTFGNPLVSLSEGSGKNLRFFPFKLDIRQVKSIKLPQWGRAPWKRRQSARGRPKIIKYILYSLKRALSQIQRSVKKPLAWSRKR